MKRMKWVFLLLVCLAVCVFLVGCGEDPGASDVPDGAATGDTERTVICGLPSLTPNFNFFELFMIMEGVCTLQIHDVCVFKDANGEYQPAAADSWDVSEDGTVYTFHIRDDAKFHDGREMLAEDVVFSLDYARNSSAFASYYESVDTVTALDEKTVQVVLHYPSALFMSFFTNNMNFAIMCKDFYETMGEDYATSPETMLCSGPYYVSEWQPEVSITYTYNPYYWGEEPDIKTIKCVKITDANSAAIALQTGSIDIYLSPVSGAVYNMLLNDENIVLQSYPHLRHDMVYLNEEWGIFQENPRLREAVAYAINRQDLIDIAYEGRAVPCRFVGDSARGSVVAAPDYIPENYKGENIEKAKQIMEEEGAIGTEITIYSNNLDSFPAMSVYLQSVLNEIGFVADVQNLESGAFSAGLYEKGYEICVASSTPITYDFGENLKITSSKSIPYGNYARLRSEELDSLLDAGEKALDVEERVQYYSEAVELLWDNCSIISLCCPDATIAYRNDLVCDAPEFRAFQYFHWAE